MADLIITILVSIAVAGAIPALLAYRLGERRGYSRGYTDAKDHAREKAALVAEETERERVEAIRQRRSEGARKAWVTRKTRKGEA